MVNLDKRFPISKEQLATSRWESPAVLAMTESHKHRGRWRATETPVVFLYSTTLCFTLTREEGNSPVRTMQGSSTSLKRDESSNTLFPQQTRTMESTVSRGYQAPKWLDPRLLNSSDITSSKSSTLQLVVAFALG